MRLRRSLLLAAALLSFPNAACAQDDDSVVLTCEVLYPDGSPVPEGDARKDLFVDYSFFPGGRPQSRGDVLRRGEFEAGATEIDVSATLPGFSRSEKVTIAVDDAGTLATDHVRLTLHPGRKLVITIRDDQGRPIPGAKMTSGSGLGWPEAADADGEGRIIVNAVDTPAARGLSVKCEAVGFKSLEQNLDNLVSDSIEFVLHPGNNQHKNPNLWPPRDAYVPPKTCSVRLKFLDQETGQPIANHNLIVGTSGWDRHDEETDARGTVIVDGLHVGLNSIVADVAGYGGTSNYYTRAYIVVLPEDRFIDRVIKLHRAKTLHFTLESPDGSPVANRGVYFDRLPPYVGSGAPGYSETDADGRLILDDVVYPALVMEYPKVNGDGYIDVLKANPDEVIRLVDLPSRVMVKGRLTRNGAHLVRERVGGMLWWKHPHDIGSSGEGQSFTTDSVGRFRIFTEPGEYVLHLKAQADFIATDLSVSREAAAELQFELSPFVTQRVSMTILNDAGRPAEGIALAAYLIGEYDSYVEPKRQLSGRWEFDIPVIGRTTPALARVSVYSSELYSQRKFLGVANVPIPTPASDTPPPIEVTCRIPIPGTIRFQLAGAGDEITASLRHVGDEDEHDSQSLQTAKLKLVDGAGTWSDIPPGSYWLVACSDPEVAQYFPTGGEPRWFVNSINEKTAIAGPLFVARVEVASRKTTDMGQLAAVPFATLRGKLVDLAHHPAPPREEPRPTAIYHWPRPTTFEPYDAYCGFIRLTPRDKPWSWFEVPVYFDGTLYAYIPAGEYDAQSRPAASEAMRSLGRITLKPGRETVLPETDP